MVICSVKVASREGEARSPKPARIADWITQYCSFTTIYESKAPFGSTRPCWRAFYDPLEFRQISWFFSRKVAAPFLSGAPTMNCRLAKKKTA